MTDYLEQLLEQQASDEEDEVLDWNKGRTRLWEKKQQSAGGGAEQAVGDTERYLQEHEVDDAVMARQNFFGRAETQTLLQTAAEEVWQKRIGQLPLVGQLARLRRAVLQVREHNGSASMGVQAAMQPGIADVRYGGGLSVRKSADYAAAVDAAFQRDARRYDGPLGLL